MKRRLPIIFLLLAVAGFCVYYFRAQKVTAITLTGIVTTDDYVVSAQMQGRLESLKVDRGSVVKKGELLAVIQPDEQMADMSYYQNAQKEAATQVSQSQADLRYEESLTAGQIAQAQANLAVAQAQVTQARADQESSRLTFDRTETVFKQGVETQQTLDLARTAYDAQKAHVEALEKQVVAAEAALDLAKNYHEQVAMRQATVEMNQHQLAAAGAQRDKARVQLGYTEIAAPSDGVVDVRAVLPGDVVTPGEAIVTIINPDALWIRADVEETYIDRIHLNDVLTVTLPSGATLKGTVFFRGINADFATQRDVSRTKRDIKTFEIRLRCDNTNRALAVGMTAYVTLPLENPAPATAQ